MKLLLFLLVFVLLQIRVICSNNENSLAKEALPLESKINQLSLSDLELAKEYMESAKEYLQNTKKYVEMKLIQDAPKVRYIGFHPRLQYGLSCNISMPFVITYITIRALRDAKRALRDANASLLVKERQVEIYDITKPLTPSYFEHNFLGILSKKNSYTILSCLYIPDHYPTISITWAHNPNAIISWKRLIIMFNIHASFSIESMIKKNRIDNQLIMPINLSFSPDFFFVISGKWTIQLSLDGYSHLPQFLVHKYSNIKTIGTWLYCWLKLNSPLALFWTANNFLSVSLFRENLTIKQTLKAIRINVDNIKTNTLRNSIRAVKILLFSMITLSIHYNRKAIGLFETIHELVEFRQQNKFRYANKSGSMHLVYRLYSKR